MDLRSSDLKFQIYAEYRTEWLWQIVFKAMNLLNKLIAIDIYSIRDRMRIIWTSYCLR